MFPWALGLGVLGYIIGIFVGADAMQDVNTSELGGGFVQTWLQVKIFSWVAGLFGGLGLIIGLVIDFTRESIDDARWERRRRSWFSRPAASKREQDQAADSMVARQERFEQWRAEGKTPEEINELEAAVSREEQLAADRRRQERFAKAAKQPPIKWPKG